MKCASASAVAAAADAAAASFCSCCFCSSASCCRSLSCCLRSCCCFCCCCSWAGVGCGCCFLLPAVPARCSVASSACLRLLLLCCCASLAASAAAAAAAAAVRVRLLLLMLVRLLLLLLAFLFLLLLLLLLFLLRLPPSRPQTRPASAPGRSAPEAGSRRRFSLPLHAGCGNSGPQQGREDKCAELDSHRLILMVRDSEDIRS